MQSRYYGLLHYHLKSCGVRSVMQYHLRALITGAEDVFWHIDLFSCDAESENGRSFCEQLQEWAKGCGFEERFAIRGVEIKGLGYVTERAGSREAFEEDAGKLAEKLSEAIFNRDTQIGERGSCEGCNCEEDAYYTLHVHNANLGKNAVLSKALQVLSAEWAEKGAAAGLVYQMHDFAEDNRPACWTALRECCAGAERGYVVEYMYPQNAAVRWVTINSADKQRLMDIGLAEERITVLPNPLDTAVFGSKALEAMDENELKEWGLAKQDFGGELQRQIGEWAKARGFCFEQERRIVLAPIKAIRRKNIAELVLLLLWLNYHEDRYQLLITLSASGDEDKAFEDELVGLVKEARLPMAVGFGMDLLEPAAGRVVRDGVVERFGLVDLLAAADRVVTTSVQEGFGYVFHEPWLAGRAVVGRDLDFVTRDFKDAGMELGHLYDHVAVPTVWLSDEDWRGWVQGYHEKINRMREMTGDAGLEYEDVEDLVCENKVYEEDGEGWADWADLDKDLQLKILRRLVAEREQLSRVRIVGGDGMLSKYWYLSEKCPIILSSMSLTASAGGDDDGMSEDNTRQKRGRVEALIAHNRTVIERHYSLAATAVRLGVLCARENLTADARGGVIDNDVLFEQGRSIDKLRLLV